MLNSLQQVRSFALTKLSSSAPFGVLSEAISLPFSLPLRRSNVNALAANLEAYIVAQRLDELPPNLAKHFAVYSCL